MPWRWSSNAPEELSTGSPARSWTWWLSLALIATSNSIQRLELRLQILHKWPGRQRLAGDELNQLACTIPLAVAVDVVTQPFTQRLQFAAAAQVVQIGHGLFRRIEELGRVQIAERIRREVPEPPHAPVDVLQAALRVVGRRDAQELLHAGVP